MTNLDSVWERDITLLTKVHLVKGMVFPVVMYGCESWTMKKAESWRIDAFELWCRRRSLRVPWTARRTSQTMLKEINSEYSLEGLILKLQLQYFGHLMWRGDLLEKTLMLGKIEGKRRGSSGWAGWMAPLIQWIWLWANSGSWWRTGSLVCCSLWSCRVRHDSVTKQQQANTMSCCREHQEWFGEHTKRQVLIGMWIRERLHCQGHTWTEVGWGKVDEGVEHRRVDTSEQRRIRR